MHVSPEFDLTEELEIPYKPDLKDWIEDNLLGLKKICISIMQRRDKYDRLGDIEFYEKEEKISPTQKPKNEGREIKANEICEVIMKIIQFDIEAKDTEGKYRIQCIRYMGPSMSDKKMSKHIEVPRINDEAEAGFTTISENDDTDLKTYLITQNQQLHDRCIQFMGLATGMMAPMQGYMEQLLKTNNELATKNVEIHKLQFQKDMWEQDKIFEKEIGLKKIEAGKEKFGALMKQIEKSGAINKIVSAGTAFLQSKMNGQQQQGMPQQVQQEPEISEEELARIEKEKFEQELKTSPVKTVCNYLWESLDAMQRGNLKRDLNFYSDLEQLLTSSTEKEALGNLSVLKEKFSTLTDGDKAGMMKVAEYLDEEQQGMVMRIIQMIS
jgi:hypothetical protein